VTAAELIREAASDGLRLELKRNGELSVRGNREALTRWTDEIRKHKPEILAELEHALATTSRWWLIHYLDRDPLEVSCCPEATHAEVLGWHPDAVAAEPCKPGAMAEVALSPEDDASILVWLESIGECNSEMIAEVLTACRSDPEALAYLLRRAGEAGADASNC